MIDHLPKFLDHHGPPTNQTAVPEESLTRFSDSLPPELLDIWRDIGWCSFGNGFLWIVNPDEYKNILDDWAPPAHSEVILRTGFGDMIYWANSGCHLLDVDYAQHSKLTSFIELLFEDVLCPGEFLEKVLDEKIFEKALRRLGPPNADECYGYVPAIGLGGSHKASNLKRVKLREHLSILSQLHK